MTLHYRREIVLIVDQDAHYLYIRRTTGTYWRINKHTGRNVPMRDHGTYFSWET
jgi:hypothetical protein